MTIEHGWTTQEALDLRKQIEALQAELAACKKDAERYRWLRDQPAYPIWKGIAVCEGRRDEIIDAAIKEST